MVEAVSPRADLSSKEQLTKRFTNHIPEIGLLAKRAMVASARLLVEGAVIATRPAIFATEKTCFVADKVITAYATRTSAFGHVGGLALTVIELINTQSSFNHLSPAEIDYFQMYQLPLIAVKYLLPNFVTGGILGKRLRLP